jgi:hypothetical protein
MPFEIRKISDVGTRNPIVARLAVQTIELIKFLNVTEEQRELVKVLYLETLKSRLIRCERKKDDLVRKLIEANELIEREKHSDARIKSVPHVIDLQGSVESFLYEAKNYLRDLLQLFAILYGSTLKDGSDFTDLRGRGQSNLVEWATLTFGDQHHLTQLLVTEQEWTSKLVRSRNAVEHPGGKSGSLTIQNIRAHPTLPKFIPPTWQLTGHTESDIVTDMSVGVDNCLTLAEDLLVHAIIEKPIFKGIEFYQIPEDKRDATCPIRIRTTLSKEFFSTLPKGNPS